MVIADETKAFTKWISNPNKWTSNSIYEYYDFMYHDSLRAIKGRRRPRVSKESVANATRNFLYYVPNQWQGTFDQCIEVSRA